MASKGGKKRAAAVAADTGQLRVREPSTAEEMQAYYDLRWRILREPWSQGRGQERDEHETEAIHLAAWLGGRMVGVGRVHFIAPGQARIRYMAVETALQGRGIGGRILAGLEQRARAGGAKRVVLNARDRAVEFYRRHGYRIVQKSEVLFDAIPHWEMQKSLR
ncbi:MAG TPA: GNAT family N-acetyltransferase [Candidatus Acidoferrales bacterium]|nr:GNAT family N-acetyltransferase [Candidatus Acidoferrales bacterium]